MSFRPVQLIDRDLPPTLFQAADGLVFYGSERFTLRAGVYGTGNGALVVMAQDGTPECKLTINLVDFPSPDFDEFYVRLDECSVRNELIETGFFYAVIDKVVANFPCQLWGFSRCMQEGHIAGEHQPPDEPAYRIACVSCRAEHERNLCAIAERLLAQDSIDRIKADTSPIRRYVASRYSTGGPFED